MATARLPPQYYHFKPSSQEKNGVESKKITTPQWVDIPIKMYILPINGIKVIMKLNTKIIKVVSHHVNQVLHAIRIYYTEVQYNSDNKITLDGGVCFCLDKNTKNVKLVAYRNEKQEITSLDIQPLSATPTELIKLNASNIYTNTTHTAIGSVETHAACGSVETHAACGSVETHAACGSVETQASAGGVTRNAVTGSIEVGTITQNNKCKSHKRVKSRRIIRVLPTT